MPGLQRTMDHESYFDMQEKRSFAIQSLLIAAALNAILLIAGYVLAQGALAGAALAYFGTGALVTLFLWFGVHRLGYRYIDLAAKRPQLRQEAPPTISAKAPPPVQPVVVSSAPAVQMLSILQRKGRLIDFLQEDLSQYDDAQIGAAVRSVHEGCKQALDEHLNLEPIYREPEGASVTIARGFDAHAVRLVGDVAGDPPFKGALRHPGWRVTRIQLPEQGRQGDAAMIVAAAEVEVNAR